LKFWWLTDSRTLAAEKSAVEALGRDENWFKLERWRFHEGRFSAEGILTAHSQRYPVRLIYPDQYPEVPAWVEPQGEVRWTTHQYEKGALCLELRPDNWLPGATGVDVLRSAYNLLVIENPLGEGGKRAPSAHDVGELQAYDWGPNPVLIGAGCAARIRAGTAVALRGLRWMAFDEVWPIVVHDEEDRRSARRPPGADLNSWRFEVAVYISAEAAPAGVVDRAGLLAAGGFDAETAVAVEASTAGLAISFSTKARTVLEFLCYQTKAVCDPPGRPRRRRSA
jgi:hypothetical protein